MQNIEWSTPCGKLVYDTADLVHSLEKIATRESSRANEPEKAADL